jgi:hypothetical protein
MIYVLVGIWAVLCFVRCVLDPIKRSKLKSMLLD